MSRDSKKRHESYSKVTFYREGDVLPITPEFILMVRSGSKTTTIRKGIRKVQKNAVLILRGGGADEVPVLVIGVKIRKMKDLDLNDAHNEGYSTVEELLGELLQIYPNLSGETPLTIISFRTLYPDETKERG